LSPNGEDTVLVCSGCNYSANIEKAVGKIPNQAPLAQPILQVPVFNHSGVKEILEQIQELVTIDCQVEFGVGPAGVNVFVIPKGREVNETKLLKNCDILCRLENTLPADPKQIHVVIDLQVPTRRDCSFPRYDIINSGNGDQCLTCDSELREFRAIEVAHTFYLGTKYSRALEATVKNAKQEAIPFEMGCYGIGVSRLLAASVECNHDKDGIVWPKSIAPYKVCVILIPKDSDGSLMSSFLETLSKHIPRVFFENDIILDDREVSFGYKMKDALLVGYSNVIVVGKNYFEKNEIEIHHRTHGKTVVAMEKIADALVL
jgi:prolyl-tRNA synthetase